MISRDYTHEIGMAAKERRIPQFFTYIVFAVVALATTILVRQMNKLEKSGNEESSPVIPVKVSSR